MAIQHFVKNAGKSVFGTAEATTPPSGDPTAGSLSKKKAPSDDDPTGQKAGR